MCFENPKRSDIVFNIILLNSVNVYRYFFIADSTYNSLVKDVSLSMNRRIYHVETRKSVYGGKLIYTIRYSKMTKLIQFSYIRVFISNTYCSTYIYSLQYSHKLGLFGMLKLALALQFIVTNAYFSVTQMLTLVLHATLK